MTCPNCRAESPDGGTECSSCGVIFAKWQARQEARTSQAEAPAGPALLETPRSSSGTPLKAAFGVMAAVLAAAALLVPGGKKPAPPPKPQRVEAPRPPKEAPANSESAPAAEAPAPDSSRAVDASQAPKPRSTRIESADEIAASWGMKAPKGVQPKFWLDDPKMYAAAHQINQTEISKQWARNVAGDATGQAAEAGLGWLLLKLGLGGGSLASLLLFVKSLGSR